MQAKVEKKQPTKRSNATSGTKAHNDNRYIKVGRVRMNSWASKYLAVRDIIIYETELVHINNKHGKELRTIGMTAYDFVKFIVDSYNEIYKGSGNSYLLVVRRLHISDMAAIELHKECLRNKEVYKISTATPIKEKQLCLKKKLCANDH